MEGDDCGGGSILFARASWPQGVDAETGSGCVCSREWYLRVHVCEWLMSGALTGAYSTRLVDPSTIQVLALIEPMLSGSKKEGDLGISRKRDRFHHMPHATE